MSTIRRREFIAGAAGAAAWPLAARAQQSEPVRLGELWGLRRDATLTQNLLVSLRNELTKLGWVEGGNLRVDYRFDDGDPRLREVFAEELVNLRPNAIFAFSGLALSAVKQRTQVIPIVFYGAGDPVDNNYVSSVARPLDNVTGFANVVTSLGSKWLELLKEAVPSITRVGHVLNSEYVNARPNAPLATVIDASAPQLGIKIVRIPLRSSIEIERDISAFAAEPNGALLWTGSGFADTPIQLAGLALQYRLPYMYGGLAVTREGGLAVTREGLLMSHGPDLPELVRGAASYVDRILRGAKPGDLPVQYPTKFTLTVNLKTAKAIGLTIPASFLLRADEVIE